MTRAKKFTWMQVFQTIMLTISTPFIIGIFNKAVEIHDFIVATKIKDQVQDETISEFRIDIGLTKKQAENNRVDIATLFGLLPEENKRKTQGR